MTFKDKECQIAKNCITLQKCNNLIQGQTQYVSSFLPVFEQVYGKKLEILVEERFKGS